MDAQRLSLCFFCLREKKRVSSSKLQLNNTIVWHQLPIVYRGSTCFAFWRFGVFPLLFAIEQLYFQVDYQQQNAIFIYLLDVICIKSISFHLQRLCVLCTRNRVQYTYGTQANFMSNRHQPMISGSLLLKQSQVLCNELVPLFSYFWCALKFFHVAVLYTMDMGTHLSVIHTLIRFWFFDFVRFG